MPYTYTEFKDKVAAIVKDESSKLSVTERDGFIQQAAKLYSRHRPREVVKDITGTGAYDYAVSTNMTAWIKGFSTIKSIEYPADERDPVYLEDDEFTIYEKEAGQYLRFTSSTPLSTEKIRVTYTALHILSDSQNTIPASDEDAVANLAASFCSHALASAYAQVSDATIAADSVNHRTKSQEYQSRAKDQKRIYLEHMGIKEGEVAPASVTMDTDLDFPWGEDRLTHPRKYR